VCCDVRCAGQCQSCNLSGSVGICSSVKSGQPVGGRAACTGTGACGGSCGGAAACVYPGTTVSCRSVSCDVSTLTAPATCNGAGACPAVATSACPSHLRCQPSVAACLAQCAATSDCLAGFYCAATTCTATKANGATCATGVECVSGQCFDNVCCNVACGGSCQACGSTGTCTPVINADDNSCTGATTCSASGACVTKPNLTVSVPTGSSTDFGAVVLNTSKIQSFTVSNTGGQPTSALTILVAGTDFAQVTGATGDCVAGAPLPGVSNCTVRVRLTPSASVKRTGTLSVSATAGGSPVPLMLTGRVISEFTVPQPVFGITSAQDGNLWMTGGTTVGVVMRMTLAGAVSTFTVNINDEILGVALPGKIISGRLDTNVWFVESALVVSMSTAPATAGTFTRFSADATESATSITSTSDGHIWASNDNGTVVQLLTSGIQVLPDVDLMGDAIHGLATGTDGFIRATQPFENRIVKFADGSVPINIPAVGPTLITSGVGTDAALYFIETAGFPTFTPNNKIGRITNANVVTEFTIPTAGATVRDLVAAPDGTIWFTESATNKLGRFTPPNGPIVEFATPSAPGSIGVGPDGNVWFGEAGPKVASITP
jgi:streptogramin lyase